MFFNRVNEECQISQKVLTIRSKQEKTYKPISEI